VAEILGSAVPALVGAGQVARATAFADRALEIASTHGPRAVAASEFALARALAADGKDRLRALAVARSARARLEGLGYRRLESEIVAWLAKMAAP